MATTALKSCQETLAQLQEKQEHGAEETRVEHQKLKETREKLQALKHQFLPNQTGQSEMSMEQESLTTSPEVDLELLREKIKEQLELNSKTTFTTTEVAEKIDELVEKVITLEAAVSSQTALVRRLKLETDELQAHIRTLEEDKETLIEDSDNMSSRLRELEEEFSRVQSLNRSVEDQNNHLQTHFTEASYALDHLSEKLQGVKLDMGAEDKTWSQEVSAVLDVLPEKEFKEHEDLLPQGNASVLSEDTETNEEGKKDENPDCSSSVKAEEENFIQDNPGNDLVISENMKTGNQEKKGHVPDLSAKAPDTPEKEQELKERKEDEKQDLGHTVDSDPDIEDQDLGTEEGDQPNWRQLFLSGLEHREKTLLEEYTSILRSYKEVKKKLSEAEKKNRDNFFESAMQIRELKNANALKDEEIRTLYQNISPQTNPGENGDTSLTEDKPSQQGEAHASISRGASSRFSNIPSLSPEQQPVTGSLENQSIQRNEESTASGSLKKSPTKREQGEIKEIPVDESLAVATIEEKLRADIDDILEENLEFWLRFSTSYHQMQKFQTSIQDLQAELLKLKEDKKKNEGGTKQQSIKSDACPIYTHMREIQTELTLWLEHNALLKEELQGRFSSLCNLQEEISRISDADSNAQEVELSHYQAAKFQGELLNMKQENNKVKEELLKGLERVRGLQLEVERTLSQLDEDFEISKSKGRPFNLKNSVNRTRIPLRSFLFGVKFKKQKPSFFACMSPTLQKQYSDLTAGLPP